MGKSTDSNGGGVDNRVWNEKEIKTHYRDNYRYDAVDQYRHGNRFERFWFKQRINIIARVMRKTQFSVDVKTEEGGYWVIDVGSGTSAIGSELSRRFIVTNTLAIDISPWCIRKAKEYHGTMKRMHFAVGDAFSLPVKDSVVSVVLLTEVIEHVIEYKYILVEVHRVLKNGGLLAITVPYKYHPLWHLGFLRRMLSTGYGKKPGREEPFHRSFTWSELKEAAMEAGFEPVGHRLAGMGITLMGFFKAVKG